MRIVLDLQGCQSASQHRGIGRYSLGLAKALVRYCDQHDYWLAMNGALPVSNLRRAFAPYVPRSRIKIFEVPRPVENSRPENAWRGRAAELIRESFFSSLKPDIVHMSSLFEGFMDDAVTSISDAQSAATAVTLYDLIPLMSPEILDQVPYHRNWYKKKIDNLRKAQLLLAISEHSRQEAANQLGIDKDRVVAISAGVDERFRSLPRGSIDESAVRERYGLSKPFLMCNMSGYEPHKNLHALIEAIAQLPRDLLARYQLAIVGELPRYDARVEQVVALAEKRGLGPDQVVFTDYISDWDLATLYNLCHLFVMPSLREGFGLPAAEAMRCGAAVIGANTTSLPEVIGREDALFDPYDAGAIAAKILEVLVDEGFRQSLREFGPTHAMKFTWEACAKRVASAFSNLAERKTCATSKKRPLLAFISPLPPEQSGISDYSDELLGFLTEHYEIDLVAVEPETVEERISKQFHTISVQQFEADAEKYDRVLYQFGNSPFHSHMFSLLERYPGTVVLHDFFLSAVLEHMESHDHESSCFQRALYYSHGYAALKCAQRQTKEAILRFPCSKGVIDHANGVIVHSEQLRGMARNWFGTDDGLCTIPLLRSLPPEFDRQEARASLGLREDELVVASFGHLADTKLNEHVLAAWLANPFGQNIGNRLVFVGEATGKYGEGLRDMIRSNDLDKSVTITGFASRDLYARYLRAADIAVQLRTAHRGETSRATLDCLAHGLPTIINAHGTMADIPSHAVIKLPDQFHERQLADALSSLLQDKQRRKALGEAATRYIAENHDPKVIVRRYFEAIEHFAVEGKRTRRAALLDRLCDIQETPGPARQDLLAISTSATVNECSVSRRRPQLFVDVSVIRENDKHTGIERVVRAILDNLTESESTVFRVEPVYFCQETRRFRYARSFGFETFASSPCFLDETPIEYGDGDIFLGLDWNLPTAVAGRDTLTTMRERGVQVVFAIYDLLPVLQPRFFPDWLEPQFTEWLTAVTEVADGTMCISKVVAHELHNWLDRTPVERDGSPLKIGYFHLGCDVEHSVPTEGIADAMRDVIAKAGSSPYLLMVGTIEPRKGHAQTLEAFDLLWRGGQDVNLVVVGHAGWMVDHVIDRLRSHPEAGNRLFWFDQASDDLLQRLYQSAAGLIVASEGEGFGLPLVEAARYNVPIIARDLPVFREVGGANAYYFSGETAQELADAVSGWLKLRDQRKIPSPDGMERLTWAESAEQLLAKIVDDEWLLTSHSRRGSTCSPETIAI